jgi:hypothetical protein
MAAFRGHHDMGPKISRLDGSAQTLSAMQALHAPLRIMAEEFVAAAQTAFCAEIGVADIDAARRQWDALTKHVPRSSLVSSVPWQLSVSAVNDVSNKLNNAVREIRDRWYEAPFTLYVSPFNCPPHMKDLVARALLTHFGLATDWRTKDLYGHPRLDIKDFVSDEWKDKAVEYAPISLFQARCVKKKRERDMLIAKIDAARKTLETAKDDLQAVDDEIAEAQALVDKKEQAAAAAAAAKPKKARKQ